MFPQSPNDSTVGKNDKTEHTSKAYNRSIKNFKDWANSTTKIRGPHREIVTPRRLYEFLLYIDETKRKPNGDRYSFSFYEQHVSSSVILYDMQREMYTKRPDLEDEDDDLEGGPGIWHHPRDKNVKMFLRDLKKKMSMPHIQQFTPSVDNEPIIPTQTPLQRLLQFESATELRLDAIDGHLKAQADSLTQTNALISLYHTDLSAGTTMAKNTVESLQGKLATQVLELKDLMSYLIDICTKNQELIFELQRQITQNDQLVAVPSNSTEQDSDRQESSTPLSMLTEELIPKIVLGDFRNHTVASLYKEYSSGILGQPSLKLMEDKYGTRWRINGKNNKTILRRLKVGSAIEYALETTGRDVQDVIKEFDEYLWEGNGKRKRSTYWLSENLPLKYNQN